jgi:hypothetical protein
MVDHLIGKGSAKLQKLAGIGATLRLDPLVGLVQDLVDLSQIFPTIPSGGTRNEVTTLMTVGDST